MTGCSVQVGRRGVRGGRSGRAARRQPGEGRAAARSSRRSSGEGASADAASVSIARCRPCPASRSTASPTAARRSSGRGRSSRSRTAARSSARTASSRRRAARSGASPRRPCSQDVRRALRAGHREIVLTGINIGTYDGGWSERGFRGAHTRSALTLAGLVRRLLDETPVERIRLSSIEPQHVDDELLRVWSDGAPRTLPHFHLPLQSGDDGVLRRMGRRYMSADYARGRRAGPRGGPGRRDPRRRHRRLPDRGRGGVAAVGRVHPIARLRRAPRLPLLGAARARRRSGWPARSTSRRRSGARPSSLRSPRTRGHAGRRRHVGAEVRRCCSRSGSPTGAGSATPTDHTLVAAGADATGPLENAIGRVRVESVDPRSARSRRRSILAAVRAVAGARRRSARWPLIPTACSAGSSPATIPSTKVHEDELVVAFRDIAPRAPTHILVIPRDHIASAADLTEARRADARAAVRDRRRAGEAARGSPTPATGSSRTSAAGAARPSTTSTSTCSAADRSTGRPG